MRSEVISAQAATLLEWSEMWGREDGAGALAMQKSLLVAAETAEAVAAGTPLPVAPPVLPEMPQTDQLRDDDELRAG